MDIIVVSNTLCMEKETRTSHMSRYVHLGIFQQPTLKLSLAIRFAYSVMSTISASIVAQTNESQS
jgi:hypothetical protein